MRDLYALGRLIDVSRYFLRAARAGTKGDSGFYDYSVVRDWAQSSLDRINVTPNVTGESCKEQCIFVGNHISYIDIPLILSQQPTVFVAKKELARWPVLGRMAKSAGTIFVKRSKEKSRKTVLKQIESRLLQGGHNVCIFPAGTTSLVEEFEWKKGAFRVAQQCNLKIQPFRIRYSNINLVSYVGDEHFVPKIWGLFKSGEKITVDIEYGTSFYVDDPVMQSRSTREWCREFLV